MELTLKCNLRRVNCANCGVRAELVPWAEPAARHTKDFEEHLAYLAQRADKTTISATMRVTWRTVGSVVARVIARRQAGTDRLDGLTHIGVDELSYRRHHEYVTVVVDHVAGAVVWVRPGKNADTLRGFFTELGAERTKNLEAVTIDMSGAYIKAVTEMSPEARIIFDRFHVQRLAHEALDEVRRDEVRKVAGTAEHKALKQTRWALQKNPWNLTKLDEAKVARAAQVNKPLYRAYLLKSSVVEILGGRQPNVARSKLTEWISWARRSRLTPFVRLSRTIAKHIDGIVAYVATGLSNARTEGINGKIRTITRRAFGFHSAAGLIGLIFLCCSGLKLSPIIKMPFLHP